MALCWECWRSQLGGAPDGPGGGDRAAPMPDSTPAAATSADRRDEAIALADRTLAVIDTKIATVQSALRM
eukprot:9977206-Heterocapsa_arctica.AAC.1